jgi:hypothetical protein
MPRNKGGPGNRFPAPLKYPGNKAGVACLNVGLIRSALMKARLNMTNKPDATGEAESLENGAQNQISSTPEKDALSEKSLDDVSGGAWPFSSAARASYSVNGPGG